MTVDARNYSSRFLLKKNMSFSVALHTKNQHVFLNAGVDPLKMSFVERFPEGEDIYYADIRLEKITKTLWKENYECKEITMDEYFDCVTRVMKDSARQLCRTPYTQTMVGNDEEYLKTLTWCTSKEDREVAVQNMTRSLVWVAFDTYKGNHVCHKPCSRTFYEPTTKVVHGTPAEFNSIGTPVYVYYSDSSVKIDEDVLVYDNDGLVSAIGGTLGLFLGVSIFSMASKILKILCKKPSTQFVH